MEIDLEDVTKMGDEIERLRAERDKWKERCESLTNFNPNWDMLEATQESLREHMKMVRKAFAAGFKERHETPDINMAWEDWYTRQNTGPEALAKEQDDRRELDDIADHWNLPESERIKEQDVGVHLSPEMLEKASKEQDGVL